MAFKVKINVLLLLAILVTIGTAWFASTISSAATSAPRPPEHQRADHPGREKLAGDISQKGAAGRQPSTSG